MSPGPRPVMVFAGDFRGGSTERSLAAGFRKRGWVVHEVDRRDFALNAGRDLLLRGLSKMVLGKQERTYRSAVLDACAKIRPPLLMTVKGIWFDRELLDQVRALGVRNVMYYPDIDFNHTGVDEGTFELYDLFVTSKSYHVEALRKRLGAARVAYVPHGYSDAVHQPVIGGLANQMFDHDVLYAGNHSAYKERWLSELLALKPGLDLAVVGNRWERRLNLPADALIGQAVGAQYCRAIQSARINVALHFGPTASGWEDLVSTRTFEIPACGGFMLHIDSAEVREFFKPGVDIDVFSSTEELAEKIAYYLAHPEARQRLLESAYARCVPAFGYSGRAEEIDGLFRARRLVT